MGKRHIVVGVNVQDRDLGGYVKELQQKVEERVQLPGGYYIEWEASSTTWSARSTT